MALQDMLYILCLCVSVCGGRGGLHEGETTIRCKKNEHKK